jgi:hypothetical protein
MRRGSHIGVLCCETPPPGPLPDGEGENTQAGGGIRFDVLGAGFDGRRLFGGRGRGSRMLHLMQPKAEPAE